MASPIYIPHDDSILQALLALGQSAAQGRRFAIEDKRFKEEKRFRQEQADLSQTNLEVARRAGAIARLTSMAPEAATQFALAPENERSLREELGDSDFAALRQRLAGGTAPDATLLPQAAPAQDFSPAGGGQLDLSTGPKPFRKETSEEGRVRTSQEQSLERGKVELDSARFDNAQKKGAFYAGTRPVGPEGKLTKWSPELRKQFESDTKSIEVVPVGKFAEEAQALVTSGLVADQGEAERFIKWRELELPKREAAMREFVGNANLTQAKDALKTSALSRKYTQALIDHMRFEDDEKNRVTKLGFWATLKPEDQHRVLKAVDDHVSNAVSALVGATINGKAANKALSPGDMMALFQPFSKSGQAWLQELGVSGDPLAGQHYNATVNAIENMYGLKLDNIQLPGKSASGISTKGPKIDRGEFLLLMKQHRESIGSKYQAMISANEAQRSAQPGISPRPGAGMGTLPTAAPTVSAGTSFIDAMNQANAELEEKIKQLFASQDQ